jgi:hypothetical protein
VYLLYLDESGNENDPTDRYFVLAGVALFERQTHYLSLAIEAIQERYFPGTQPIEFHASEIRSGRGFWRSVSLAKRRAVLDALVSALIAQPERTRSFYAAVIEKSSALWGERAVERATEEICRRFDIRLMRSFQVEADPQRGLLVFSEGRFDERARLWVRGFRERGTKWGALKNLADIPYFASTRESRLLQAADLIAHATWLLYERQDAWLASRLLRGFDERNGVLHGLVHVRGLAPACDCPACSSRRSPGSLGNWIPQRP